METEKPTFSLRWKIALIACATAGLSAFLIVGVSYYSLRDIAREKAVNDLAHEANLAALKVAALYEQMKSDLFTISGTAAVSGFVAATRNGGVDPRDGATLDNLRTRLAGAFTSLMSGRPTYMHMRYLGIADNGRELVRVTRMADGRLHTAPAEELQENGGETFFKESLGVKPGAFYISRVAYKLEHGVVEPTYMPAIRVLLPVFDSTGERFGMLVINANFDMLLKEVVSGLPKRYDIFITNASGDYLRRDATGKLFPIQVSGAYRETPPGIIEDFVTERLNEGQFTTSDQIGYARRFNVAGDQHHGVMGVLFLPPADTLFADAETLARRNLVIAAAITLAAGLLAAALAELHTWPIRRITAAIELYGRRRGADLDLPVDAKDEVGVMARAFRTLAENLDTAKERNESLSIQLETFIQSSVDGIVMIDERGGILEINPAALQIFGYERGELIGRNVSNLLPGPVAGQHDQYLRDYLRTGRRSFIGSIREVEGRHKDGQLIPLSVSVTEILLPDKRRIFGGVVRDMSAVHEAHNNVALYMAELERSNHELDQFAYVASHDLKAPLRVIDNASRWLEEDLAAKLTEEDKANMSLLRGRVGRMEKLLDDLLEYSRIGKAEDGRFSETLRLDALVGDIVLLLEPPPAMRVVVPADFAGVEVYRMPLQRVLYNLIGNAIKHHDRKTGTIELTAEERDDHYLFAVKDDGPGIPSAYREVIFEMFRTLKPRDQVEGSGMGLALVKKTVESKGGTISVESCGERGSAFTFSWPKTQPKKMAQATGKAA